MHFQLLPHFLGIEFQFSPVMSSSLLLWNETESQQLYSFFQVNALQRNGMAVMPLTTTLYTHCPFLLIEAILMESGL